jgi:hypothetical protein
MPQGSVVIVVLEENRVADPPAFGLPPDAEAQKAQNLPQEPVQSLVPGLYLPNPANLPPYLGAAAIRDCYCLGMKSPLACWWMNRMQSSGPTQASPCIPIFGWKT